MATVFLSYCAPPSAHDFTIRPTRASRPVTSDDDLLRAGLDRPALSRDPREPRPASVAADPAAVPDDDCQQPDAAARARTRHSSAPLAADKRLGGI
jgi:hypothetical protein